MVIIWGISSEGGSRGWWIFGLWVWELRISYMGFLGISFKENLQIIS